MRNANLERSREGCYLVAIFAIVKSEKSGRSGAEHDGRFDKAPPPPNVID
jgi:hypothetical protein